jgi:hypothetical protein
VVPAALTPPGHASYREVSVSSPPNQLDIKQQQIGYDHALMSSWAKVSDLTSDIVAQLQYTLPQEHLRSLALYRDSVSEALPKVAASMHDPALFAVTSPLRRGGASTSLGEVVRTPTVDALEQVDAFRDEVELLMKHHQYSIESRIERREAQLQEVRNTNSLLARQKERLEHILQARQDEDVQREISYSCSIASIQETLQELADRIELHQQREQAVDAAFISKDASPVKPTTDAPQVSSEPRPREALDELTDRGLLLNSAVAFLASWTTTQQHHARVYAGYQTFLTETETEEARARRWKNRFACANHPEAFAEYVNEYQQSVNERRQEYLNEIAPVETYVNTISETQNDNRHRKMTRSRSPVRDRSTARSVSPRLPELRLAELAASQRPIPTDEQHVDDERAAVTSPTCLSAPKSPRVPNRSYESVPKDTPRVLSTTSYPGNNATTKDGKAASPYVPMFYAHQLARPVSPSYSQVSGPAPKSPRRPLSNEDLALLPDTARTDVSVGGRSTTRSAAGRSPSRREAAFRPNGMVHVCTSEQAVDHFLVPRQANATNPRTNGGVDLPSLQTLLLRKKKLQAELSNLQALAKKEMVVQMRMMDGAQRTAEQRLARARRRREAPVLADI